MNRSRGYTLIELLITMTAVAILLAIAFPSYKSYVVRASREQAETLLLSLAGLEEKIFLNSSAYAVGGSKISDAYNGKDTGGLGLTTGKSPDGKYTVTVTGTTTTFVITATPVAGTAQEGDGNLTIDDAGTRKWGTKSW